MRKANFIFIAIVLVAASINWIRSCSGLKSHKEVFGYHHVHDHQIIVRQGTQLYREMDEW